MRKLILSLILISNIGILATASPSFVTRVEAQRGEKWWGLFTADAPSEPFSVPFLVDTNDPAAQTVPMMVSSNGRYIWSSRPFTVEFDGKGFTVTSESEKVEVQKAGKTLREAYLVCCHKNFPPEGTVPDKTLYSMPVYETRVDVGFLQDQDKVIEYATRLRDEGFPAGIIVIPEGWNSPDRILRVDSELYPDPRGMVAELHKMGFRVMLTVTPYVAAYGKKFIKDFGEGSLVRDRSGSPLVSLTAGGYTACYDITDERLAREFSEELQLLKTEFPVDGLRFDCRGAVNGFHAAGLPVEDYLKAWIGLAGEEKDVFHEFLPGGRNPVMARNSALEYRPGRDEANLINDFISAGLVGVRYSSLTFPIADTTEIFSSANSAYSAFRMGLSTPVAKVEFAPWRIVDPKLYEQMKQAVLFRASTGEYVAELVAESARTAEPLLRHMEYQFPNNGFADCNDQFMIGPKYLFAPSLDDSPRRMVRLPRGTWLDKDGKRLKGPLVMEVDCGDGSLIYYELVSR